MNSNLLLDFSVNKENNSIHVKRVFKAPLENVWAAWTQSELLDQWWAPKPYYVKTKSMDFKPGGCWLYAMISPEGDKHWCKADYKSVDTLKSYSALDAFCDEHGTVVQDFPRSLWTNSFNDQGESTQVSIVIKYEKLEDLEQIIQLGFKEGFTAAVGNLDALLSS
jgi:uncharacterized protein YndB with AHSA1/START domain